MTEDPEGLQAEIDAYLSGVRSNGNGAGLEHGALTDMANAARFIALHATELRYCHPWKRWLRWTEGRWLDDDTGHTTYLGVETMRSLLHDAADIHDPDLRKRAIKEVIAAERASRIRGMLELATSHQPITILPTRLDADPWLFNVTNGTVNLQTGDLQPHNPDDLITKQAPVAYDATAEAPEFQRFLARVVPDPELRSFLQRAVGYSLTGSTTEQILLILYGAGQNGKSTLMEVIRALLGDYGQQAPPETFLERRDNIPNDVARLRGARFVSASEITEGRRLNEALVKRMTGGDTMTARFMHSEFFEFKPQFTPWLSTNHKPEIRGTDYAIWRRVKLVPFNERITEEEKDGDLPAKLNTELPGILAWAIKGCLDWQFSGLSEPASVTHATREYRADMDIIGGFLEDRCRLTEGHTARASDLFAAYREWAKTTGNDPVSQQLFGRRLSDRGLEQRKTSGGTRSWDGISLLGDQETAF